MSERPNILFINTDQHSYDAISAYGNAHVQTPGIDRIHQNGTSFTRSYCSDPVCAPARGTWMSGLYSSEHGVSFNCGHMHEDIPDLGEILQAGGYNPYHCGKWHVDGRELQRGFNELYYGKLPVGAGGAEFYDPASTHALIDFLASYEDDKPFYLQVGYVNPHDICQTGHNYEALETRHIPDPIQQGAFTEEELPPLPSNLDYDPSETYLHIVSRRIDDCLFHKNINKKIKHFTDLEWRMFRWHYYRYIEKVDQEISFLLNALESSRFKDNTLIIFTADHGEAAGAHKMFQKFTLYEESIHVPFIIASLGDRLNLKKNTIDSEHYISGVDLLPTVCDYAGINLDSPVSGNSVKKIIDDSNASWRDSAYVESNYWGRCIIHHDYKYVTEYIPNTDQDYRPPRANNHKRGLEQLFDLANDPGETVNLASKPEHRSILLQLRAKLIEQEQCLQCNTAIEEQPKHFIDSMSQSILDYWQQHPITMPD